MPRSRRSSSACGPPAAGRCAPRTTAASSPTGAWTSSGSGARSLPAPLVAVGVRFHPGVAPGLLRLPAAEFVDGHVALDAVDAELAARLEPALDASRTLGGAFDAFNRELLRHVDRLAELDGAVAEATSMLDHSAASVADVSSRVYVSERQLRRRFAERVGYGPKTLHRVLRFQRLVSILGEPGTELARAAVTAGYADQAHLTRECRELSGLTPAELAGWLGGDEKPAPPRS